MQLILGQQVVLQRQCYLNNKSLPADGRGWLPPKSIATPVLSKQQVVDQITILLNGQTLFAHEIIQAVRDIGTLSQRELEVLRRMADYCTSGEIASQLSISLKTVDGHVTRIFARLRVNNRRAAIHRAKHLGWIK